MPHGIDCTLCGRLVAEPQRRREAVTQRLHQGRFHRIEGAGQRRQSVHCSANGLERSGRVTAAFPTRRFHQPRSNFRDCGTRARPDRDFEFSETLTEPQQGINAAGIRHHFKILSSNCALKQVATRRHARGRPMMIHIPYLKDAIATGRSASVRGWEV